MKKIFRYLIGELNGFYVNTLGNFLNVYTEDVLSFLSHVKKTQFFLSNEEGFDGTMDAISPESLYGLCTFSGLFKPRIQAEVFSGSIRFVSPDATATYKERGLLNRISNRFEFPPIWQQSFDVGGDITALATDEKQASFIPHDAPVIGYIKMSDTNVIDYSTGLVSQDYIDNHMSRTEPEDEPFYPFYGNQYLHLAEAITIVAPIEDDVLKQLFESCQKIRYNGESIKAFLEIIESLFGIDYFKIVSFANRGAYQEVHYKLVEDYEPSDYLVRLGVLDLLLNLKFKQFVLVEE